MNPTRMPMAWPSHPLLEPLPLATASCAASLAFAACYGMPHGEPPGVVGDWRAGGLLLAALLAWVGVRAFLRGEARGGLPRLPLLLTCLGAPIALGLAFAAALCLWHFPAPAHLYRLSKWLDEAPRTVDLTMRVVAGPTRTAHGWVLSVEALEAHRISSAEDAELAPLIGALAAPGALAMDLTYGAQHREEHAGPLPLPGDVVRALVRLESPPPRDLPATPDLRRQLLATGRMSRATALEPPEPPSPEALAHIAPPHLLRRLQLALFKRLARQRLALEAALERHLQGDALAVTRAMLTGARAEMRPAFREGFDRTATSHLLAISGLHLGVLAALVWWGAGMASVLTPGLVRRYGRRRLCAPVVLGVLGLYVVAIGMPVSALRALGMCAVAVLSLMALRPICPIHALCLAALGILAHNPMALLAPGMWLSFAASLGILLFLEARRQEAPRVQDEDGAQNPHKARLWRMGRKVAGFVGVSLSATVATTPIVWGMTGEVVWAGFWVNLLVVPLVTALVFPAMVAGALGVVLLPGAAEPLAGALLACAAQAMAMLAAGLEHVARWPGSVWCPGQPGSWVLAVTLLAALVATAGGLGLRAALRAVLLWTILSVPALWWKHAQEAPLVEVHYIPVGQGDATLVVFGDGRAMLIDAGGRALGRDPGRHIVVPYLRRLGIARLDWVVVTHAHLDHIGGMQAVIEALRPRHFVFDAREEDGTLAGLKTLAKTRGAMLHPVQGRWPEVGAPHHGADLETLPVQVELVRPLTAQTTNDASLVTRLTHKGATLVFAGDVEAASERWLMEHAPPGRAVLVNMPHHGSRTSSSEAWLETVRPRVAIASCGRHNHFGHPHPEVLARYEARGTAVWRTDRHGLVRVALHKDGTLAVRAMRPTGEP